MFPQLDFSGIRTQSVKARSSKVTFEALACPIGADATFAEFADSLPAILKARDLRVLAGAIASAHRHSYPVLVMMGAHVVKVGLAPIIVHLMEQGIISAVAMNSAAAIHDSEAAMFGSTSEDVAVNLLDGTFGMWTETGDFINGTLAAAASGAIGYGEALGRALLDSATPHAASSILAAGVRLDIPVTVHAAIGTDIVHQQPGMDGAVTGEMSFRDFRVLAHTVKDLRAGSVVLNLGSAVLMPEVFLKALTVVRNLGHEAREFTAVNFDMIQHYRPNMNVVSRPTQDGGKGYSFTGHHEIMIPLLAAMIQLELGRGGE